MRVGTATDLAVPIDTRGCIPDEELLSMFTSGELFAEVAPDLPSYRATADATFDLREGL